MNCRHCQDAKANRPRGLCWGCYYRPGVRDLYAPARPTGNRGSGLRMSAGRQPAEPCPHPPWSPERLATLERRALNGEAMHHPNDCRPE